MKKYCLRCAQEYEADRSGTLMRVKTCGATYCKGCDEQRSVSDQLVTNYHGHVVLRSVDGYPLVQFETGCTHCASLWVNAGVPVLMLRVTVQPATAAC